MKTTQKKARLPLAANAFVKAAIVASMVLSQNFAMAASDSGHMTFEAYSLADMGMRASMALRLAQNNQSVDNSIATMAFLPGVGEIHFVMRNARELGTVDDPAALAGIVERLNHLKQLILTKGTTVEDDARGFSNFDRDLAKRNLIGASRDAHTMTDMKGFHIGFGQTGHTQVWTRADELNPERIRRLVRQNALKTTLYALLDHDNVLFNPETRAEILKGVNRDPKALTNTIENLNALLKQVNQSGAKKLSQEDQAKVVAELEKMQASLRTDFSDPADRLEKEFWSRERNKKLEGKLPVRGSKEYFAEFIVPQIKRRALKEGALVGELGDKFIKDFVDARQPYHLERLAPAARKKLNPHDRDSSAMDDRDLVSAYLTKDLVHVALTSEILRDMLIELQLISPETKDLAQIPHDSPAHEIVRLIGERVAKSEGSLPFIGINDIFDFSPVNKRVFGNGFGPDKTALRYLLNRAREMRSETFDARELSANYWEQTRTEFGKMKSTDPAAAARMIADLFQTHVNSGYDLSNRTKGQLTVIQMSQEISQNLAAKLAPMPESWGPHTQIFDEKTSDQYVVAEENRNILDAFAESKGFKFKYTWSPSADMMEKLKEIWKRKEAIRLKRDIKDIAEPNPVTLRVLYHKKAEKYSLVDPNNTVLVGPSSFREKLEGWFHGMDRLVRSGWAFMPTPKPQIDHLGQKGGFGNDYVEYAQLIQKGWNNLALFTDTEYEREMKRLTDLNNKWTRRERINNPNDALNRALKDSPEAGRARAARSCRALLTN